MSKARHCGSKRRYESKGAALVHSRRLQRMYGSLPTQAWVYKCKHCGGFHVGHSHPKGRRVS